jgi:hypothetical protein
MPFEADIVTLVFAARNLLDALGRNERPAVLYDTETALVEALRPWTSDDAVYWQGQRVVDAECRRENSLTGAILMGFVAFALAGVVVGVLLASVWSI